MVQSSVLIPLAERLLENKEDENFDCTALDIQTSSLWFYIKMGYKL